MDFAPGNRVRTRDLEELLPSVRGADGVITAPEYGLYTPGWWVAIDGEDEPRLMLQEWLAPAPDGAAQRQTSAVATV